MSDAASGYLADMADAIMSDLELANLRARYRFTQSHLKGSTKFSYFYTDPYQLAFTRPEQDQQARDALTLNEIPRIVMRRAELAASGIRPRVVAYSEPGNTHLTVFVEFSEHGRRVLEGSGFALSELIRSARKYLWIGYYLVAVVVLGLVFGDRIARFGWWQVIVSLSLVVAAIVLIRRMWR